MDELVPSALGMIQLGGGECGVGWGAALGADFFQKVIASAHMAASPPAHPTLETY